MTGMECLLLIEMYHGSDVKDRIVNNIRQNNPHSYDTPLVTIFGDAYFTSLDDFVSGTFNWASTPEGQSYWYQLNLSLKDDDRVSVPKKTTWKMERFELE